MESRKKAVDFLKSELKPGDAVLFKGSRGMKMDELLNRSMSQNFIPVTDDRDYFIGIVTRQDIIRSFVGSTQPSESNA
jgi:CBS domain-containing protein